MVRILLPHLWWWSGLEELKYMYSRVSLLLLRFVFLVERLYKILNILMLNLLKKFTTSCWWWSSARAIWILNNFCVVEWMQMLRVFLRALQVIPDLVAHIMPNIVIIYEVRVGVCCPVKWIYVQKKSQKSICSIRITKGQLNHFCGKKNRHRMWFCDLNEYFFQLQINHCQQLTK